MVPVSHKKGKIKKKKKKNVVIRFFQKKKISNDSYLISVEKSMKLKNPKNPPSTVDLPSYLSRRFKAHGLRCPENHRRGTTRVRGTQNREDEGESKD